MARITRIVFLVLVASLVGAPVLASGEGGGNIFSGDIGNVFWTLLVFGLVVAVLGKFAWTPLLDGLNAREGFIRESLEAAKKDRDEAHTRLQRYEDKLNEARAEAKAIVEEGRRDAEVVRQRVEEEAGAEAEKIIERAKREIGIARETAVKEIYTLSGQMATEIAGRIVERELKPEDHERLIADSISELARTQPN